nr:hypothetical protein B0A51_09116 [Rachicladosporium sp. CCFEE 5018]
MEAPILLQKDDPSRPRKKGWMGRRVDIGSRLGSRRNAVMISVRKHYNAIASAASAYENHLQTPESLTREDGVRPKQTVACHGALALPELLERVVLCLSVNDALRAMRINGALSTSILQSARLRKKLSLQGDPEAAWTVETVFTMHLGLSLRNRALDGLEDDSSPYSACFDSRVERPGVPDSIPGRRIHSMLVCQLPVFTATGFVMCTCSIHESADSGSSPPSWIIETITFATGVTFGELKEAAQRLRQARRSCPPYQITDRRGKMASAARRIRFMASISFLHEHTLCEFHQRTQFDDRVYGRFPPLEACTSIGEHRDAFSGRRRD